MKVSQELKRVIQAGIKQRIESRNKHLLRTLVDRHKDLVEEWKKARNVDELAGKQVATLSDRLEKQGIGYDCCTHKLELDSDHRFWMNEGPLADRVIAELQSKGDDQAPSMVDVERLVGTFFAAEVG